MTTRMSDYLQLVTKSFKPAPETDTGALLLETVEATMQDLAAHYWYLGDRSAALALSIRHEQIKKIHADHEKGQKA